MDELRDSPREPTYMEIPARLKHLGKIRAAMLKKRSFAQYVTDLIAEDVRGSGIEEFTGATVKEDSDEID